MKLARPLDLVNSLTPPDRRLDPVPLLDLALLAVALSWLSSSFVAAPGLTLGLEPDWQLPQLSSDVVEGLPAVEVMTVKQEHMILYQGQFFTLSELEQALGSEESRPLPRGAVLLLKADQNVNLQTLFRLAEWARARGYHKVQIAGDLAPAVALPHEDSGALDSWVTP